MMAWRIFTRHVMFARFLCDEPLWPTRSEGVRGQSEEIGRFCGLGTELLFHFFSLLDRSALRSAIPMHNHSQAKHPARPQYLYVTSICTGAINHLDDRLIS